MSNTLNFSASEISARLALSNTAVQPGTIGALADLHTDAKDNLVAAINETESRTGSLDELSTAEKGTLVSAINELFGSASEGKSLIAAAITGEGVETAATDSFETMAANVAQIRPGWLEPLVTNGDSITPTGSYATSTYYDTSYGVKVGYCAGGDILISMMSGTTTAYENLNFTLSSAPTGVKITTSSTSWDTSDPAGNLYVCVLSGITSKVKISIAMGAYNATYDYTTCAITVTEA